MSATHAAVVLAAGGSRRLGRPKQLLTRDGETLVHRAVRLAADTAPARLLTVVGAFRERIERAGADLACEFVFNPEWDSGLASSLRAAAAALADHDGPVLILGCDQPAMTSENLLGLLAGAAISDSRCAAVSHEGAPGIPAVVTAEMLRQARMSIGDRGLGARLREWPAGSVYLLDEPELGFDIDDEAGLRAAVERALIDPPEPRLS